MQLYPKLIIILFIVTAGIASCTKGIRNEEQFFYGKVAIELATLPNTPEMDLYIGNGSAMVMRPGLGATGKGQTSEKKKISIYKKGTKELVADTLIQLFKDSTLYLKVAYSEPLGISGFLGKNAVVAPDSCTIQLFNNLPNELQPDGVDVDALLCEDDGTGQIVELGIEWDNFKRNKLHPLQVTVPQKNYYLKFRNRSSGEFLLDAFGRDAITLAVTPGKYLIVTASSSLNRNRIVFFIEYAEL